MRPVVPVILSGGSGTRLWPLSRPSTPKQFIPLVGEHSLLQDTLQRLRGLGAVRPPIVVCNDSHRFLVAEQLREIDVAPQTIVLEPVGRNTAPAVTIAALLAVAGDAGADPLLLVLPADHVIRDAGEFVAAAEAGIEAAAAGLLVTFGVVPDKPETGYGYLLRGPDQGRWAELERFVEKPDAATARQYVASGRYLWNSGMFLFSARRWFTELERQAPAMLTASRRALAEAVIDADFTRLGAAFGACESNSIDYAVMERAANAAVVPLAAGWSDVGSWAALHEAVDKDADGNVLRGEVIAQSCRDSYIASSGRLVVSIGVDGVVIVETPDAVLVMAKDRSQDLKAVVEALRDRGR
jgi:mannose-1-phosphate guanylyltransferase/mannose-6-phosphate isomerase